MYIGETLEEKLEESESSDAMSVVVVLKYADVQDLPGDEFTVERELESRSYIVEASVETIKE